MDYDKQPSSLVKGKTKGELHKEIVSGKYYDKKHEVAKKMSRSEQKTYKKNVYHAGGLPAVDRLEKHWSVRGNKGTNLPK